MQISLDLDGRFLILFHLKLRNDSRKLLMDHRNRNRLPVHEICDAFSMNSVKLIPFRRGNIQGGQAIEYNGCVKKFSLNTKQIIRRSIRGSNVHLLYF